MHFWRVKVLTVFSKFFLLGDNDNESAIGVDCWVRSKSWLQRREIPWINGNEVEEEKKNGTGERYKNLDQHNMRKRSTFPSFGLMNYPAHRVEVSIHKLHPKVKKMGCQGIWSSKNSTSYSQLTRCHLWWRSPRNQNFMENSCNFHHFNCTLLNYSILGVKY